MSDIVLLGGNILNGGIVANKEKYGAERVWVFDWNENPEVKGDCFIQCDIKDYVSIIKLLKANNVKDVAFAYTSADLAVRTQQKIHEEYGLLVADDKAVANTLCKGTMTRLWDEAGVLNRISKTVEGVKDLEQFDSDKEWIVKPNLCSGSRGITILKGYSLKREWEEAYRRALTASWDEKVVVEEFVHGTEYTVEMLGDNSGNVEVEAISKKYHTVYNNKNKIATKLHYNAQDIPEEVLSRLTEVGRKCYKAVGLHTVLGHLEVIVSDDGRITPLEIGARSSGYIASNCVDAVIKDLFLKKYAQVIRGGQVGNGYQALREKSSMLFFYDMPEGRSVQSGTILEFLTGTIKSEAHDRRRIKADENYYPIDGDGERYGFEVLVGDRDILTIENVIDAEKQLNQWMYYGKR